MFGGGFGSNTGFGQPQQQQQQQQPAPLFGGFGGGGAFGAPAASGSAFGNPGAAAGVFGGANTGVGAAAPQMGAFGAPANTTSAFGAATTSGFGSNTGLGGGGMFGGVGMGATNGNAFGAANNTGTSAFGASTTGQNMFGATQSAGMGTGNLATSQHNNQGTGNPAYQETMERDSPTSATMTKFQSINAMPAYQNWSFEELRLQDYAMNKKFSNSGVSGGFGQQTSAFGATKPAFGSASTTTSAFGGMGTAGAPASGIGGAFSSSTNTFGATQPATNAFGQPAQQGGLFGGAATTNTFGSTGTGAFGMNNQQQGQKTAFPFGGSAQTTTGFGAAPTTTFGAPATNSSGLFGAPKPAGATTGGLFGVSALGGTATTSNSLFGGQAPAAAPAFGATQPGAFSQPAATQGGGLFGSTTSAVKPAFGMGAFGTPASTVGAGLFGAPQTTHAAISTQPFGAATSTAFSQPGGAFGGGLFGAQQPATTVASGGLFGAPAPSQGFGASTTTTGLFGNTTAKPAGLFGYGTALSTQAPSFGIAAPQNATGGLFGAGGGVLGGTQPAVGGSLFGNTAPSYGLGQIQNQPQVGLQAKIDQSPYGFNPLLQPTAAPVSTAPSVAPALIGTPAEKKKPAIASSLKVTPRSAAKIKLRNLVPTSQQVGPSISEVPRGIFTPSKVGLKSLQLTEGSPRDPASLGLDARFTPRRNVKRLIIDDASEVLSYTGNTSLGTPLKSTWSSGDAGKRNVSFDPSLEEAAEASLSARAISVGRKSPSRSPFLSSASSTPHGSSIETTHAIHSFKSLSNISPGFRDEVADYIMDPPLQTLLLMSDEELRRVERFTIRHSSFGSVCFLTPVDLLSASHLGTRAGIEHIPGTIVIFEPKLCIVYPDEENKPPVGFGLNVPAEISLTACWPIDKATRQPIKNTADPRYDRHMSKLETMPETQWLGFNSLSGTWLFRVEHFSKYGIEDDDEDEVSLPAQVPASTAAAYKSTPALFQHVGTHDSKYNESEVHTIDLTTESSYVKDSFMHVRNQADLPHRHGPLTLSSSMQTKKGLGLDADESDSKLPLFANSEYIQSYTDSQGGLYIEQEDEMDDQSFDNDKEVYSESSDGSNLTDEAFDSATDGNESETADHEIPDTLNVDAAMKVGMPMSILNVTTSAIDRMSLAHKVQTMKQSLFRSAAMPHSGLSDSSKSTPHFFKNPVTFHAHVSSESNETSIIDKRPRTSTMGVGTSLGGSRTDFNTPSSGKILLQATFDTEKLADHHMSLSPAQSSPQKYHRADSLDATVLSKKYLSELAPFETSVVCDKNTMIADSGLYMGRSFRVGWGRGGSFVVTGSATQRGAMSRVSIRKVNIFEFGNQSSFDQSEEVFKQIASLKTVLEQTQVNVTTIVSDTGDIEEFVDDYQNVNAVNGNTSPVESQSNTNLKEPFQSSAFPHHAFGVPRARLSRAFDFFSLEKAIALVAMEQHSVSVTHEKFLWKLASALWDDVLLDSVVGKQKLTHAQECAIRTALRKEALSEWLISALKDETDSEVDRIPHPYQRIMMFLTGRLVSKAIGESVKNRDLRLASILSQINGPGSRISLLSSNTTQMAYFSNGVPGRGGMDVNTRQAIIDQLLVWQQYEKKGLAHISPDYLDILRLISGDTNLWDQRVCPSTMNWKRSFGLFFWYGKGGDWRFSKALETYVLGFQTGSVPWPRPAYQQSKQDELKKYAPNEPLDACYHLLQLAVDPAYSLEPALHPHTSSMFQLDYRIPWLLSQMLVSVKQVRNFKDTMAETAIIQPHLKSNTEQSASEDRQTAGMCFGQSKALDCITISFVAQLESLGLWKWAIFVSLFVGAHSGREELIRVLLSHWYPLQDASGSWKPLSSTRGDIVNGLLTRQPVEKKIAYGQFGNDSFSDDYLFLTKQLRIPAEWIHEARALRSRYMGNFLQELVSLLDAKHFAHAQRLFISKIAPMRIINEDFAFLKQAIDQFDHNSVDSWEHGAGLFKRYIDVVESATESIQQIQDWAGDASKMLDDQSILDEQTHRAKLLQDILPEIHSVLKVLSDNALSKLRSIACTRIFLLSPKDDRLLGIAVAEMSTRLSRLSLDIGYLENDDIGLNYTLDGDLLRNLPLVPEERIGGIRLLVTDWIDTAL
ncbi:hypothetical protein QVD99_000765 [Batrachochytrium dendrobatidis]|nr:hypothetical protein O5D80_003614 [Batrachochytrium dendrobatidis]KAK5673315.1 hypothetical protein QVD99_000765 [Batrachochytrium dendrobatidis]